MANNKRSKRADESDTAPVKKIKLQTGYTPVPSTSNSPTSAVSKRPNHAGDCDNVDCPGCDEGDMDIVFMGKDSQGNEIKITPSAMELLAMAKEEQNNNVLAGRLFDMALEAFEELEQGKSGLGYARCLVELGQQLSVQESLREALELYIADKSPSLHTQLWHTRCAWALAQSVRRQKEASFEDARQDLENSDDSEIEDQHALLELMQKNQLTRQEIQLYTGALQRADTIVNQVDRLTEDEETLLYQCLKEQLEYLESLEHEPQLKHTKAIGDALIKSLDTLGDQHEHYDLIRAAALLHQQKYVDASEKDQAKTGDAIESSLQSFRSKLEAKKEDLGSLYHELLAMLRLNQSNYEEDEEKVVECYEEAIDAFKKALQLDPGNTKVKEMLQMLDPEDEE
ncbi:hypothetical protein DM01DRAFT_1383002 [Hesseltinella vesiculosa]|uniref:Uncharacterized protein n=1 Tax=Hesseltinella vesiculosa TaxID=101127 RepID=A0A1X2GJC0_9FUNG|nr:hypothetical protein DM01DRAFT_1383002 [Hesseltinella vesiculosa]